MALSSPLTIVAPPLDTACRLCGVPSILLKSDVTASGVRPSPIDICNNFDENSVSTSTPRSRRRQTSKSGGHSSLVSTMSDSLSPNHLQGEFTSPSAHHATEVDHRCRSRAYQLLKRTSSRIRRTGGESLQLPESSITSASDGAGDPAYSGCGIFTSVKKLIKRASPTSPSFGRDKSADNDAMSLNSFTCSSEENTTSGNPVNRESDTKRRGFCQSFSVASSSSVTSHASFHSANSISPVPQEAATHRREELPRKKSLRPVSILKLLRHFVGADLTKVSMPVALNEPLSFLQRLAEDFQYSQLLRVASSKKRSIERLAWVAIFAATPYASTIKRFSKPFNPLLGETFEVSHCGFRFLAEQVSHHPPISAYHCSDSDGAFDVWGHMSVSTALSMNTCDVTPIGTIFLELQTCNGPERYSWTRPRTTVHNVFWGSLWLEWVGNITVMNYTTGESARLEFLPRSSGWFEKGTSAYQINGAVKGADSSHHFDIGGSWADEIWLRAAPMNDTASSGSEFVAWKADIGKELPEFYNMSTIAIQLNEITPDYAPSVGGPPPTDSRFRPDQRLLEMCNIDDAEKEKVRMEAKQRKAAKSRTAPFKPRWFELKIDEFSGEHVWCMNEDYWRIRDSKCGFTDCPDIF